MRGCLRHCRRSGDRWTSFPVNRTTASTIVSYIILKPDHSKCSWTISHFTFALKQRIIWRYRISRSATISSNVGNFEEFYMILSRTDPLPLFFQLFNTADMNSTALGPHPAFSREFSPTSTFRPLPLSIQDNQFLRIWLQLVKSSKGNSDLIYTQNYLIFG